jgi:short subunit dehydrogenase-like uncharacterized protein
VHGTIARTVPDRLLIYGATGYTGTRIACEAVSAGMRPILAGRSAARLASLASRLGVEHRVVAVEHAAGLDAALRDVDAVLNVAGPFGQTATPIVDACLRTGTHYLDVTGEVLVIESLRERDAEARQQGLMILPAAGFDVVASDCLAAHVAARLPDATHLYIGISGLRFMTRGSAKSFFEFGDRPIFVRRDGKLAAVVPATLERLFDFGDGARACCAMAWGDVACAYYTTGIPNVETYLEATPQLRATLVATRALGRVTGTSFWQTFVQSLADLLPETPLGAERNDHEVVVVAEAVDARGRGARARLHTPDPYTTTALCAVRIAARVLAGDWEPGFQTPARVYGADLVAGLPGVRREELAA